MAGRNPSSLLGGNEAMVRVKRAVDGKSKKGRMNIRGSRVKGRRGKGTHMKGKVGRSGTKTVSRRHFKKQGSKRTKRGRRH